MQPENFYGVFWFALFLARSLAVVHSGKYQLFRPVIESAFVVDAAKSPLQYNHDASIALFNSVWIAVWNGNENPLEGQVGQYNYMATSKDLKVWTAPEVAFSNQKRALNPVACNASTCVQWQPNLFAMADGRLGCVWSGRDGKDGDGGTYFSVLTDPLDKLRDQV
jgi:hypothetical protein